MNQKTAASLLVAEADQKRAMMDEQIGDLIHDDKWVAGCLAKFNQRTHCCEFCKLVYGLAFVALVDAVIRKNVTQEDATDGEES